MRKEKNKNRIITIILLILILLIASFIGFLVYYNTPDQRIKRQLDLGDKYLSEMDYEEAVLAYSMAIDIDAKAIDAYIGLAKSYEGLGEYELACDIAKRGIEMAGKHNKADMKQLEDIINKYSKKNEEELISEDHEEVVEKKEESSVFSGIPRDFVFSSGAGGWSTDIEISEDGSFVGQYHDSDMGDIGDGYPNGTLYTCSFSGRFSKPEATDNQFIYSMKLLELDYDEEKVGTEEIIDDTLTIYSTPYGFEDSDEYLIYMPGSYLSDMTEECRSWIYLDDSVFKEVPDGFFVIYNVGGQEAFTAQSDASVWYRDFIYEYGSAYSTFSPSYYMGSYLDFFTAEDSPASLALSVPWDGKSSKSMECKKAWEDNGDRFNVNIVSDKDEAFGVLQYRITVECISDPKYDFSVWGSSEPGKFSAVFTEKNE